VHALKKTDKATQRSNHSEGSTRAEVTHAIGRRQFLEGAGATLLGGALAGCSFGVLESKSRSAPSPALRLPRLRASVDRITNITVCTRPFRAQGPRLDVEKILGKTVVHNYGHGGSGWSLSWGSSAIAAENAMASGERQVAVIGCGAMGLSRPIRLSWGFPQTQWSSSTSIWCRTAKMLLAACRRMTRGRSSPSCNGNWSAISRRALRISRQARIPLGSVT
jgi:hypothetical protein